MKLPLVLVPIAFLAREDLSTKHEQDRWVVIACSISQETEVTHFEFPIDGESPDGMRGGDGESSSSLSPSVVTADRVLEANADGPTRILREFHTVEGKQAISAGDEERESQSNSPLPGVTLELVLADGDVSASVSEGETWDWEKEALGTALGFDFQQVLFTRPERAERGGGEGDGGRRQRGGMSSSSSSSGGGGGLAELQQLEWEAEAKLGGAVDHEGSACYEISLKFEASGELPKRPSRGRDPATALEFGQLPWVGTSLEIELEGRLLVSIEGHLPVLLELEGELSRELERTMDMSRSTAGTLKIQIEASTESAE